MQAFLIMAYRDEEYLIRLVTYLSTIGKVYVHINTRSKDTIDADILNKKNIPNTVFYQIFDTSWGNKGHYTAVIEMLNLILKDSEIDYIHIMSGSDLPVKSKDDFSRMFKNNKNIYMSCENVDKLSKATQERYRYFHFLTDVSAKNKAWKIFDILCVAIQKMFRITQNRIGSFENIYKGMIWVSAPTSAFNYAVQFILDDLSFQKILKHTAIPEEILFQTIFMNSEYKENIVAENLHYTDWTFRNRSMPAYLDFSDIENINNSEYFFARKVDSKISKELIDHFFSVNSNAG